jgi:hypothetical protein
LYNHGYCRAAVLVALVVEEPLLASPWTAIRSGLADIRMLDQLPMDRRHNAKID